MGRRRVIYGAHGLQRQKSTRPQKIQNYTQFPDTPVKFNTKFPPSLKHNTRNFQSKTTRNVASRSVPRFSPTRECGSPCAPDALGVTWLQFSDAVMRASIRQPGTPPAAHFPNQHSPSAKILDAPAFGEFSLKPPLPPIIASQVPIGSVNVESHPSASIASISFESHGYDAGE
jgi:hypothetical protein